jgi:quercetin dioxygenase-like cupin family protein
MVHRRRELTTKKGKEQSGETRAVLENERVKIYELDLAPRQATEMHGHPEYAGYLLTDARLRFTYDNGVGEDRGYKAGEAAFRPAQKHSVENVGDAPARILIVELKK